MKYVTIINPTNDEQHSRRITMEELVVDDYNIRHNVMAGVTQYRNGKNAPQQDRIRCEKD